MTSVPLLPFYFQMYVFWTITIWNTFLFQPYHVRLKAHNLYILPKTINVKELSRGSFSYSASSDSNHLPPSLRLYQNITVWIFEIWMSLSVTQIMRWSRDWRWHASKTVLYHAIREHLCENDPETCLSTQILPPVQNCDVTNAWGKLRIILDTVNNVIYLILCHTLPHTVGYHHSAGVSMLASWLYF